jgi:hypothetical protein
MHGVVRSADGSVERVTVREAELFHPLHSGQVCLEPGFAILGMLTRPLVFAEMTETKGYSKGHGTSLLCRLSSLREPPFGFRASTLLQEAAGHI